MYARYHLNRIEIGMRPYYIWCCCYCIFHSFLLFCSIYPLVLFCLWHSTDRECHTTQTRERELSFVQSLSSVNGVHVIKFPIIYSVARKNNFLLYYFHSHKHAHCRSLLSYKVRKVYFNSPTTCAMVKRKLTAKNKRSRWKFHLLII